MHNSRLIVFSSDVSLVIPEGCVADRQATEVFLTTSTADSSRATLSGRPGVNDLTLPTLITKIIVEISSKIDGLADGELGNNLKLTSETCCS
jgi:hypothetical protein